MNQIQETLSEQRGESMPSRMRRILEEARPNWKVVSPRTAFTAMTFDRVKESDMKDLSEETMKTIEASFNAAKETDFEGADFEKIFEPIEDETLRKKVINRFVRRSPNIKQETDASSES